MVILVIQNYTIKEDVLYLYLDYNYEFGLFTKGKSFFEQLKDFLSNKVINFKGKKIVLIASGIVIGTIFLNNNYKEYQINNNTINDKSYINEVVLNDFNDQDTFTIKVDDNTDITYENIKEEQEEIKEDVNIIQNNDKQEIDVNEDIKSIENNVKEENVIIENIQENNEIETEIDNKTMVTVYRSNGSILNIELEEYLIGVVAGEMPASFSIEALKAQSVIARTYTLKAIKQNKKLTDTVSTQVYIDNNEMRSKWGNDYDKYYNKIKEAVLNTKGMYITYNNDYIDAVYFSTSNGYTEDSKYVWGNDIPYLKSVESKWDIGTTSYTKEVFKSFDEVSNILGYQVNESIKIDNIERNESNRIISININDKTYSGINIRTMFKLNSTDFNIEVTDDGLKFITYGYGHGVGMSQYGSNGMAKEGYSYQDIIHYYYQNVQIKTD